MSFDRGTFWVLPLTYLYIPQSARAYLFLQSVKTYEFCSGPISVDPICPQPTSSPRVETETLRRAMRGAGGTGRELFMHARNIQCDPRQHVAVGFWLEGTPDGLRSLTTHDVQRFVSRDSGQEPLRSATAS